MMDVQGETCLNEFEKAIEQAILNCRQYGQSTSPAYPQGLWVEEAYLLAIEVFNLLKENAPRTWGRGFDMPQMIADFLRWRIQSETPAVRMTSED